jgi:hypothetical protein
MMFDKKISIGTLVTGATILGTIIFTQGSTQNQIETFEKNQTKTVKRVEVNEKEIVELKIGVAKIETKLDDRFNRLEEILMDLE